MLWPGLRVREKSDKRTVSDSKVYNRDCKSALLPQDELREELLPARTEKPTDTVLRSITAPMNFRLLVTWRFRR